MMNEQKREELAQLREEYAQQLRQERAALAGEVAETESERRPLESERASELEERAQQADAARMFIHLAERRKQRIDEIDQVLQRIALGAYGLCDRCGEPIPVARLRALPTARVPVQCADDEEQGTDFGTADAASAGEGETVSPTAAEQGGVAFESMAAQARAERLPPNIDALNDEEVETYILERLEEDGRIDLQELRVAYRGGVLRLEGALPSEEQHQVVLQYATDFAGVQAVDDRLVIDEVLWQREDRTASADDQRPSSGTLADAMEELVESDQENDDHEPPDVPVREHT
jgi:DnaK suppressor protein